MSRTPLISVIVPMHDEAPNILALYNAITKATKHILVKLEVIFVDDGSTDDSVKLVKQLQRKNKNVTVLELTRNFGKEIALTAGLHHTKADAALLIDADLQHPPSLIPEFIDRWQKGTDVVVGVRKGGENSLFRSAASKTFYGILSRISNTKITPKATDYRLLDRSVIDEFSRFTERNRLSRGLIDWLGFEHDYIYFDVNVRKAGQSYSRMKLLNLAVNSFVTHSFVPLKLAGYLGLIIIITSGPLGVFVFVEKYIFHDPWKFNISGPAILAIILMFLVGIILGSLGLMALYIANIYAEVMNRPLYVVKQARMAKLKSRGQRL